MIQKHFYLPIFLYYYFFYPKAQKPLPLDTILFSEKEQNCIISNFELATINNESYPIYDFYNDSDSTLYFHFVIINDSVRLIKYDISNYSYSYFKSIALNEFILKHNLSYKGLNIINDFDIKVDSIFIENDFPLVNNERCILCGKANLSKLIITFDYKNQTILKDTLFYTNQTRQNLLEGFKEGFKHVYTKEDGYIGFEGNGNFIFYNEVLHTFFFRINYSLLNFSYWDKESDRIFYNDTIFYSDGSYKYYVDVTHSNVIDTNGGKRKLVKMNYK